MYIRASAIREVCKDIENHYSSGANLLLYDGRIINQERDLRFTYGYNDHQEFLTREPSAHRWKSYDIRQIYEMLILLDRRRLPKDSIIYDIIPESTLGKVIDIQKTNQSIQLLRENQPNLFGKRHRYSHSDYWRLLPSRIEERMEKADWHYEYSDDFRVWQKGTDEIKDIIKDLQKLSSNEQGFEIANALWEKYVPEYSVSKPDFLNENMFYQKDHVMTKNEMKDLERKLDQAQSNVYLDEKGVLIGIKQEELVNYLGARMKRADWDYPYSDDFQVRQKGRDEVGAIMKNLEILSYSNGAALAAEKLWSEHTAGSSMARPHFLDRAVDLYNSHLNSGHSSPMETLSEIIGKRLQVLNEASPNTVLAGKSLDEYHGVLSDLKLLTMYRGGHKAANNLWETIATNKSLLKPDFLVTQAEALSHIRQQFKNIGAERAFTPELVEDLKKGIPEKIHSYSFDNEGDKNDVQFHLRKSKDSNLYFLNKYDLAVTLQSSNKTIKETFYLTGQDNVRLKTGEKQLPNVNRFTLKKAANYLAGRPVFNAFSDKQGNQFEAWAKRKFNVQKGEFEMVKYRKEYPFNMDEATRHYSIKDLATPEYKERLYESYKRGNLQLVTFVGEGGKEEKLYTSLNIGMVKGGSLDVYDKDKVRIPIDKLLEKGYVGNDLAQQIKDRLSHKNTSQVQDVANHTRFQNVADDKVLKAEFEQERNKQKLS